MSCNSNNPALYLRYLMKKRLPIFFVIFFFALLFIVSCMPQLKDTGYQHVIWIISQVGLAFGIVLYIIISFRGKK